MRSLRTSIALSLISVNILIIILISTSIIVAVFQINNSWESAITIDITAAIDYTLAKEYPELTDISELNGEQLTKISNDALEEHKGRLREISYYSNTGRSVFVFDVIDAFDKSPDKPFPFELLRWAGEVRHFISSDGNPSFGILTGRQEQQIGKVGIRSFPLMGMRYAVFFDQIITSSFFIGIISASLISLIVSVFISKTLSRNSRVFAGQLSKLAAGNRDINFSGGTTIEMQSSTEAAKELQNQLRHNEEAQLRKLRDIIHDLKTPVAALGIQFKAVSDGVLKVDDERISLLSAEFGRIEEIIEELSRYTKLSSEDYIPEPKLIDLNKFIQEVVDRFKLQTEHKDQKLLFEKPKLPSLIETDKLGLMRVFNNLTANALNNAPGHSSIRISIGSYKRMIDKTEVFSVEFENNGKIEDTDLPLIFDRLYRSKKSGYHGSGLGLAISKTIIEKNHGKITAVNTAFNTVVFRVELPVLSGEKTPKKQNL